MVHITGPLPLPVSVAAILVGVDVTDRWARQLGQVDLARVLGAPLTAANPVIMGLYDAAGNRMPSMDMAARPGFVDVIDRAGRLLGIAGRNWVLGALDIPDLSDRWARQLGLIDLSRVLGAALTAANPVIMGLYDAAGNRMPSMDVAARQGFQEIVTAGAIVAAGNPFPTEDTGLNTNPRRFESDNGFYSAVVARAGGVATALWTVGTVPARTAGQITTIYTLTIENSTGAAVTGWLEIGGVAITIPYHVANNDSVVIDFIAGLRSGDADVNCNASVNGVNFQIIGTEI